MAPTLRSRAKPNGRTEADTTTVMDAPKSTTSKSSAAVVTKPSKQSAKIASTAQKKRQSQAAPLDNHDNQESEDESHAEDKNALKLPQAFDLTTTSKLGKVKARCDFGPSGNYAEYDKDQNHFVLTAGLSAKKGFALEKTIFTSGPYQGYQALVLVPIPESKFPFMELAAEIRNMVYQILLAPEGQVISVTGRTWRTFRVSFQSPIPGAATQKPSSYTYTSLAPSIGLLSVSREVRTEASSILWGCNRFNFKDVPAFNWFLDKAGSARAQMRDMHIDLTEMRLNGGLFGIANSSASLLAECQQLARLSFDLHWTHLRIRGNSWIVARIIGGFRPLIKALRDRGETASSILEIIRYADAKPCYTHRSRMFGKESPSCRDCSDAQRARDAAYDKFKEDIVSCLSTFKEEDEARLIATVEAKQTRRAILKPAARRDTGRAKRKGVTDVITSYVEREEEDDEELEQVEEDVHDDVDDEEVDGNADEGEDEEGEIVDELDEGVDSTSFEQE